ncbi:hypothetical protein ACOZ38_41810 [Sphaerisporangium viridialbum]|uniref:hypothetical protein n=1 Tax=Sphaerisporangium viridialbum TaxID=46189 RepID=UPI003C720AF4
MNKKIVSLDDLSDEPTAIDEVDLGLVSGGRPMERCYGTGGTPATDWVSDY